MPLAASPTSAVVLGIIVLIILVFAGIGALMLFRKRLLDSDRAAAEPLSLANLRDMRARGQLSDAEFDAARAVILRQLGHTPAAPTPENEPPRDEHAD